MQTQSHLLSLNEVLCSKWEEDFFFFPCHLRELCTPRFVEFSVEVRGSPDLNCCAALVRMFCRTVAEALRNAIAVCTDPLGQLSSLGEWIVWFTSWGTTDGWCVPSCSQCCYRFLSSYQQEIRAFYPWRRWEVWPQQKYHQVWGLERNSHGVIYSCVW